MLYENEFESKMKHLGVVGKFCFDDKHDFIGFGIKKKGKNIFEKIGFQIIQENKNLVETKKNIFNIIFIENITCYDIIDYTTGLDLNGNYEGDPQKEN